MKRFLMVILYSISLLFWSSNLAQALSISTHAGYGVWDDSGSLIDSDADEHLGTVGTVYSEVLYGDGWQGGFVSAAGNKNGNTAARASYIDNSGKYYNFTSDVVWSNTYTVDTAGAYSWDFTIMNGGLLIMDYWYNTEGDAEYTPIKAEYSINILLDGLSVWSSSAILEGKVTGYTYTKNGADLNGEFFQDASLPIYGYLYDKYDSSINLGYFNTNDTFNLTCVMQVAAYGPGIITGAGAYFGDPGNLTGSGGMRGEVKIRNESQPIPEPATIFLLAAGLACLLNLYQREKFLF